MGMLSGGEGGLSNSSSAASRSGDASGSIGGANQTFNFGGNPNIQTGLQLFKSPWMIAGVVAVALASLYFFRKK